MPEVHIRVSQETHERLNKVLPWGAKQPVLTTVIEGLLELLERDNGQLYLGMLMTGNLSLIDVLRATETDDPSMRDS